MGQDEGLFLKCNLMTLQARWALFHLSLPPPVTERTAGREAGLSPIPSMTGV